MVKVNLLGRKARVSKTKSWFLTASIGFLAIFAVYFVGVSLYVVIRLALLNNEHSVINREIENVSLQLTSNNDQLRGFIISKHVLGQIRLLDSQKFPYKEYLDELLTYVPQNSRLRNVDFSNRGWIAVTIVLPSPFDLGLLETTLTDPARIAASPFQNVFMEKLTKERSGAYSARLQFEIRRNGS